MFKLTINFILLFFISITLSFKLPTLSYNQLSKTLTIKGTGILRSSNELKGYLSQAEYVIVEEGFNELGKGVFFNSKMKQITIPSTVTLIERNCFEQSELLETIIFQPNSHLTTIEEYAFKNCINMKTIQFPKSLKMIAFNKVFEGCDSYIDIQFEVGSIFQIKEGIIYTDNMKTLVYYQWNTTIEHLTIENGVEIIGYSE